MEDRVRNAARGEGEGERGGSRREKSRVDTNLLNNCYIIFKEPTGQLVQGHKFHGGLMVEHEERRRDQ